MLYLYGASGHAKVILEIAQMQGFVIGGLIDVNPSIRSLMGFPVSTELPDRENDYDGNGFLISIGNNRIRKRIAESEDFAGRYIETLAHPHSVLSPSAEIGAGTVVMAGATINAACQIGRHCILNTHASVDHDGILGDYVHVSPGASLAGNVQVGEGTHIGIGACIIEGIRIGRWCTIGAGAVVIRDVPDGATVVGNPARIVENG